MRTDKVSGMTEFRDLKQLSTRIELTSVSYKLERVNGGSSEDTLKVEIRPAAKFIHGTSVTVPGRLCTGRPWSIYRW